MVFSEYAKISLGNFFEITTRPDFLHILQKLKLSLVIYDDFLRKSPYFYEINAF